MFDNNPKEDGIVPVNELIFNCKLIQADNNPTLVGIVPVKALE